MVKNVYTKKSVVFARLNQNSVKTVLRIGSFTKTEKNTPFLFYNSVSFHERLSAQETVQKTVPAGKPSFQLKTGKK